LGCTQRKFEKKGNEMEGELFIKRRPYNSVHPDIPFLCSAHFQISQLSEIGVSPLSSGSTKCKLKEKWRWRKKEKC